MKGSQWLLGLPAGKGATRSGLIVDAVRAGHAVVQWLPLRAGPIEIEVSADVLRVGDAVDSVRVPMSAATQQRAADVLDCVLPTAKIADLIWDQAYARLTPHAQNVADFTPAGYLAQHLAVERELDGRSGLVACAGKDWVLCRQAFVDPSRAANYGWHVASTRELARFGGLVEASRRAVTWSAEHKLWVVQPLATRHEPSHEDYSQKARLVRRACFVDGVASTIDAVLADPALAHHISHEGVLPGARLPSVPRPTGPVVVVVPAPPSPDRPPATAPVAEGGHFWIAAKHFTPASRALVKWAVLHSTENDIRPGMARAVARYFAGQSASGPQSSAHYVIDAEEVVQCVKEASVAWAAPGANALGLQFELVGRGGPKRDAAGRILGPATDWTREGRPVMERAASLIAGACARWSIPLSPILDPEELLVHEPSGITLHSVVTDASRLALQRGLRSSRFFPKNPARPPSHQDPGGKNGARWPMDEFMALVLAAA